MSWGPGALHRGLRVGDQAASDALAKELGRRAAREPWARRFLLEVARGDLGIPANAAIPGVRELAALDTGAAMEFLRSGDASVSMVAATALGQEGHLYLDQLTALIRHGDIDRGLAGIAGLTEAVRRGVGPAIDELGALACNSDGSARWAAAAALGKARGEAAVARAAHWLERVLAEGDEQAVSGAVFGAASLWPVASRRAGRLLRAAAQSGPVGRKAAAVAMRELPRNAVGEVARLCLRDDDPDVRALSAPALAGWARGGSTAAKRDLCALARDGNEHVRAPAAALVCAAPALYQAGLVDELASDRSALVRAAVAEGLGRREGGAEKSVLAQLAKDSAASVRAAAVRSLGAGGSQAEVRKACRDGDPAVRAAAAGALRPITREDTKLLLALAADRDQQVVRAAARALGEHASGPQGLAWQKLVHLASLEGTASAAAEGMAVALDRARDKAAKIIWRWPVSLLRTEALRQIARTAHDPQVAEIARALRRALEAEDALGESLRELAESFTSSGCSDLAETCLSLAACAEASSAEEIANLSLARAARARASHLAAVARSVASALRAPRPARRGHLLERAHAGLAALAEEEAQGPEGLFVRVIASRWRASIDSLRPATESAELVARVLSGRVVQGVRGAVWLEAANTGQTSATNISVRLTDAAEITSVPDLPPGATLQFGVPLVLPGRGEQRLRARVHYHDGVRERARELPIALAVVRPRPLAANNNPYVVGKPLSAESTMFFGREEELNFVQRALDGGENGSVVVMVGHRRTGKTSLLRQLAKRLAERYRPVFVDVQGMLVEDTETFFRELVRRVIGGAGEDPSMADGHPLAKRGRADAEMVGEAAARYGRPLVLLMDEFDDLEEKVRSGLLSREVFSQLRHLIQHVADVHLVLAGTHRLEELAGDYWSFLLNLATCRRLRCLQPEEAEQVVRVPLERAGIVCEGAAVRHVVSLAGRHPYFLQLMGYRLVEQCVASGEGAVRLGDVEQAADEVVEQGEIHLRYLWENAGEAGQAVLAALSRAPVGLTREETAEATGLGATVLGRALSHLEGWDLVEEERGRYRSAMGLVGRWLPVMQVVREM